MTRTKTILLWLMAAFYVFGGFNHLMNPGFYLTIMPPDLPNPEWLNVLSGLADDRHGNDATSFGSRAQPCSLYVAISLCDNDACSAD